MYRCPLSLQSPFISALPSRSSATLREKRRRSRGDYRGEEEYNVSSRPNLHLSGLTWLSFPLFVSSSLSASLWALTFYSSFVPSSLAISVSPSPHFAKSFSHCFPPFAFLFFPPQRQQQQQQLWRGHLRQRLTCNTDDIKALQGFSFMVCTVAVVRFGGLERKRHKNKNKKNRNLKKTSM